MLPPHLSGTEDLGGDAALGEAPVVCAIVVVEPQVALQLTTQAHVLGHQVAGKAAAIAVYCHTTPLVPASRPMQKQSICTSSPG